MLDTCCVSFHFKRFQLLGIFRHNLYTVITFTKDRGFVKTYNSPFRSGSSEWVMNILSQYTQYLTLINNAILLTLRSLSEHYTDVSVNSHPIIANDRGIIGN